MSFLLCSEVLYSEPALYVVTAFLTVALAAVAFFFGKRTQPSLHTKSVVYAAVMIALSFALSYVKLFSLPQGGSVTLASLLPIMLYSYLFGVRKGILCGVICGLLNLLQEPWMIHPAQVLLDYPLAFGFIGLSGIFCRDIRQKKSVLRFAVGMVVSVIGRYLCHVVSAIFIWGSADPNYSVAAWAFLYNSFVFADCAVCLVAGCALFSSSYVRKLTVRAATDPWTKAKKS